MILFHLKEYIATPMRMGKRGWREEEVRGRRSTARCLRIESLPDGVYLLPVLIPSPAESVGDYIKHACHSYHRRQPPHLHPGRLLSGGCYLLR